MNADEEKWQSPKYRAPDEHSFMSGLDQRFRPVLICVHLRPSAVEMHRSGSGVADDPERGLTGGISTQFG
jgi:hypothetical protein